MKLSYVQTEVKMLEKKYNEEKEKQSLSQLDTYLEQKEEIGKIPLLYLTFDDVEIPLLKVIMDALANKLENGVVFIINQRKDDSVNFLCRSSNKNVNAGYIVKNASQLENGNGGGSMTFAQGGGKSSSHLKEVRELVEEALRKEIFS